MLIPTASERGCRFGTFEFDTRTGELTTGGCRVRLRKQPAQLLLALLERPGDLVTREELVKRLWPDGTFVDFERGLNKVVKHLREALGDSAEQPLFVETLPRKGYRFIAPVTRDGQEPRKEALERAPRGRSVGRWLMALATVVICLGIVIGANVGGVRNWVAGRLRPTPRISALAVLPLEYLPRDPEQEYFADGMTDALITDLAKMGGIRVTSRTSVMRYKGTKESVKEIGRTLGVDAVVEGTVTRSGDRVRVTAQLIQVSTDMHLWAEAYERDMSQILDLQRDLARDIARRINVLVRPVEPARSVNPQAYGLYLKGRDAFYTYTSRGWQESIDLFKQAVLSDPGFAPAYSGLADAYLVAGAYGAIPIQEALTRGRSAASRALLLDDRLASAHYALATAHAWYDWDWAGAEREFQRGLDLNPDDALGRNWHGGYLSLQGRHQEAVEEHERARELDPLSLIINANLARALYWARRYDDAIAQARTTLQMDPGFGVALFWLEGSLRHKGLFKDAVALRMGVAGAEGARAIARTFEHEGFQTLVREGGERFEKDGALVEAARCYAQVGLADKALGLLETCYERRCASMATLKAEPDFDVLRGEVRFQDLLRRMRLE